MTTELYEVYSLEEGDTIMLKDSVYFVQVIEPASQSESLLWIVDEEGFQKSIVLPDTTRIRVLCESVEE